MDKLALFINTAMLAMFVENAIFSRALGTSVAFYASRKKESIFGLGLGITYVIVVSSCITVLYRRVACRLAVFLCCHAAYIHADGEHSIYGQSAPPVEIPAKDIQKHQEIRSSFGVQCGSAGSIVPEHDISR